MRPVSLLLLVDNFHAGAPRIRRMVRRSALTHRAGPLDLGDPRRTHGRQKGRQKGREAKGDILRLFGTTIVHRDLIGAIAS
jgi:hypothetical protein